MIYILLQRKDVLLERCALNKPEVRDFPLQIKLYCALSIWCGAHECNVHNKKEKLLQQISHQIQKEKNSWIYQQFQLHVLCEIDGESWFPCFSPLDYTVVGDVNLG